MAEQVFQPLPTVPDHPALEEAVLALWEHEGTFEAVATDPRVVEAYLGTKAAVTK